MCYTQPSIEKSICLSLLDQSFQTSLAFTALIARNASEGAKQAQNSEHMVVCYKLKVYLTSYAEKQTRAAGQPSLIVDDKNPENNDKAVT